MTINQVGIIGFALAVCICALIIIAMTKLKGKDEWYEEGWRDCYNYHKCFEMSSDDEIVLKHLKSALRSYAEAKGYKAKGDIKKISQISDFKELNEVTWEICTRNKRGKKNV